MKTTTDKIHDAIHENRLCRFANVDAVVLTPAQAGMVEREVRAVRDPDKYYLDSPIESAFGAKILVLDEGDDDVLDLRGRDLTPDPTYEITDVSWEGEGWTCVVTEVSRLPSGATKRAPVCKFKSRGQAQDYLDWLERST